MQHSFDIDIAEKYGIKAAIIINNLQYWIEKNKANEKNYFDGNVWTYNSAKAFQVLFKYMSEKEIRSALKVLIDDGLIITGNYNANRYDHTLWYAITEKGNSILQKVYIEETKSIDQNDKKDTPYTDINTDKNANINQRERASRFIPPSEFEVSQYITELKNNGKTVDFTAEYFISRNQSTGWMIGKAKMKDWKAAVRTWISRDKTQIPQRQQYPSKGEQEILDQYLRFPTNDDLHKYLQNPYNKIAKEHLPTLKKFRGFEL